MILADERFHLLKGETFFKQMKTPVNKINKVLKIRGKNDLY